MRRKVKITPLNKELSKGEYQEIIVKPAERLLNALIEAEVKGKRPLQRERKIAISHR